MTRVYSRTLALSTLALVTLAIILSGCSSPSPTPQPVVTATPYPAASATPAAASAATPSANVTIQDFAFRPDISRIATGGSVTWTNLDNAAHTVKFSDSESPTLGNGATYTKKFDAPGNYTYYCGIHPSMTGTVEVSR